MPFSSSAVEGSSTADAKRAGHEDTDGADPAEAQGAGRDVGSGVSESRGGGEDRLALRLGDPDRIRCRYRRPTPGRRRPPSRRPSS